MWEDPLNQHGGKWLLVLLKRQKGDLLDCIWLDILMGLVGEGFGHLGKHVRVLPVRKCLRTLRLRCKLNFNIVFYRLGQVNGAVVSVKASMKIALWLGSNASDDEINQIGHKFRELMRLDQTVSDRWSVNLVTVCPILSFSSEKVIRLFFCSTA